MKQSFSNSFLHSNKAGMSNLSISGQKIFEIVLPFLEKYEHWLYWKRPQYITAQTLKPESFFIKICNKHLTKDGLIAIIHTLCGSPNQYKQTKEYWLDLIKTSGACEDQATACLFILLYLSFIDLWFGYFYIYTNAY